MLKIFLISLFASAVFALSDKCDKGRKGCEYEDVYGRNITVPETEEELDAYCEYTKKYFECMIEVLTECEESTDVKSWKEYIQVLQAICNKETELYKNLVTVLPCIKHEIAEKRDGQCYFMYRNELPRKKFEKILADAGMTDVTTEHDCFRRYFHDACSIAASGAVCGAVARGVEFKIRELNNVGQSACWDEIKEKMAAIALETEILYLESDGLIEELRDTSEE